MCACTRARMSDHGPVIDETLSSSIVAFIGSVGHLDANTPEERVARVAGNAAPDIVPRITAILDEVYSADPPLFQANSVVDMYWLCLLYTSDAADDLLCVDLGGRRII